MLDDPVPEGDVKKIINVKNEWATFFTGFIESLGGATTDEWTTCFPEAWKIEKAAIEEEIKKETDTFKSLEENSKAVESKFSTFLDFICKARHIIIYIIKGVIAITKPKTFL